MDTPVDFASVEIIDDTSASADGSKLVSAATTLKLFLENKGVASSQVKAAIATLSDGIRIASQLNRARNRRAMLDQLS